MFEETGLLGNVAVLIASLLGLNKASDITIDNSVKVAGITGLAKTIVGFMLVALSTSLPELSMAMFGAVGLENIGVPRVVLGATIVAFGTSIPEFVTSMDALPSFFSCYTLWCLHKVFLINGLLTFCDYNLSSLLVT